jgi:ATP-dependent Clp protease adaptor protein ClpS
VPEYSGEAGSDAAVQEAEKTDVPRRFQVLLHNDDYTTMDFVVEILMDIFRKSGEEALRVMLNVHENGIGVAGVYVKPVAEMKVHSVHKRARENGFPLRCSLGPE